MSVIRVGSNEKYAAGWESIFGGGRSGRSKSATGKSGKVSAKKAKRQPTAAKRSAGKKKTAGRRGR
jgi:hypothetical protein